MFKLAVKTAFRWWFWDDEDLTGEVFELPYLHKRRVLYNELKVKYPPDPHAAHKEWIRHKLEGRTAKRTVAQISIRPSRRSKHQ